MTALSQLSLLNKKFENFDREFANPFFSPSWFKEFDGYLTATPVSGMSSQMSFNDKTSAWELTLEAAGVAKDNLKVDMKEGHLMLTGEKTKGLSQGKFEKYIKIPEGVDVEKVEAKFEDGVLTVALPLQATKASKTILIK